MKKILFLLIWIPAWVQAQTDPEITSWIINLTGQTGYGGILTNVQQVQYSANNVYVTTTCIPDYTIGPWTNNPNTPVNQNFLFKITRHPVANTGTPVNTPLGHIGVWTNGVSIFNARDGMSYNNQGIWNRDALFFEGISFDNCLGHPAPGGEYHHHVNPTCLYDDTDDSHHAPIIGYAFDGFPIYGAYGYENSNGTGIIRKMVSGYRLRNIQDRTTLPNGTVLSPGQYGPAISSQYPLGAFLEDYEYVAGSGDLDVHNGRFSVTPEYPNGIYAYFVTINSNEYPVYPYVLGPTYYGTVQSGNTGPGSGHNTISEPVVTYIPGTTGLNDFPVQSQPLLTIQYPSDGSGSCSILLSASSPADASLEIVDLSGRILASFGQLASGASVDVPNQSIPHGMYLVQLKKGRNAFVTKIIL